MRCIPCHDVVAQLTASHKAQEISNRNELEAARLQKFAAHEAKIKAEAEKKWVEEKCLKAYEDMDILRNKTAEAEKQVIELEV